MINTFVKMLCISRYNYEWIYTGVRYYYDDIYNVYQETDLSEIQFSKLNDGG